MKGKGNKQQGFTLVELLIVVIILAILAAIVVPQFSSSTDDAKLSAADSSLSNLRSMIDLYYQQHGEYPGAKTSVPTAACTGTSGTGVLETEAAFLTQISRYTDDEGGSCSISDTTNHRFGPYFKKDALPVDPFKNVATVAISTSGNLVMTADAGDPGGWKYDTVTGKIIINIAAYDDR